jgi:ribose transport system substrate-binding protein
MTIRKTALLAAITTICLSAPTFAADLTTIGMSVGNLGNPFFLSMAKGARDKAKELTGHDVTVTTVSSDYDLGKQSTQIDNFIASGMDMVLLNAADPTAIAPAMARLRNAGIVSVALDVSAQGADATVQTDNLAAGRNACQYTVDKLGGKGNVIIITGPPTSSVLDRVKGCKESLAKSPDIKILSDNQNGKVTREGGMEVMIGLLSAFDKVDAVFTINDQEAIGAELAAKQLNRTDFFITSVDGAPDIQDALKQPGGLIEASSSQDPYAMAQKAVEIGYAILQGKPPAEKVTLIPTELITRDNVDQYKGWTSK